MKRKDHPDQGPEKLLVGLSAYQSNYVLFRAVLLKKIIDHFWILFFPSKKYFIFVSNCDGRHFGCNTWKTTQKLSRVNCLTKIDSRTRLDRNKPLFTPEVEREI